jgi:two-component system OmpR family response regulator
MRDMAVKLKALIVDDEPDILRIGELSLGHIADWHVLLASSGDEALAIAEREVPDVVLLDMMMPGGSDGKSTLARLKGDRATAAIPVIVMSARGHDERTRACLALGARGIICKPFDPLYLSGQIHRILEGG